ETPETGDGRRERGRRRASSRHGSCRQPRYLSSSLETGGFASPPRGGFAPSTTYQSNTSAENDAIDTDSGDNRQNVALWRRRSLAKVNLALQQEFQHARVGARRKGDSQMGTKTSMWEEMRPPRTSIRSTSSVGTTTPVTFE